MNSKLVNKTYGENRKQGSHPTELIALLLDKCALYTQSAKEALLKKDMETCYAFCEKVTIMVNGMAENLRAEEAEDSELDTTLQGYYSLLDQLVTQILSRQDVSSCDALLDSLKEMASAWRQISQFADESPETYPSDKTEPLSTSPSFSECV